MNEYALYKGDDFITIGTAQELSDYLNVKKNTIYFLATPENKRRNKGNRLVVVKIEEDET
ncbi:hypothetical protein ERUR111494_02480 [Erysipelothrix urinaevulpis]|uniref:hypothetical protein n=1 Tax=Erysipelothrix urinaevulpis TaxID=2683717 RepID=UPI001357ACC0|nr:hypothetical protein [Erysipelothrix urinaevulpis]